MVYFRFLSAQNADIPTMQATATAAIIANSVVITGASAACVGSAVTGAVNSGSIACDDDGASSTTKYVEADELPYDADPSNSAKI